MSIQCKYNLSIGTLNLNETIKKLLDVILDFKILSNL